VIAAFWSSAFAYLDGIHFLAFHADAWRWTLADVSPTGPNRMSTTRRYLDPRRKEIRWLLMMRNVIDIVPIMTQLSQTVEQALGASDPDQGSVRSLL
jgi:hypothetical protein